MTGGYSSLDGMMSLLRDWSCCQILGEQIEMHIADQQTNLEHCSLAVDRQGVGEQPPRETRQHTLLGKLFKDTGSPVNLRILCCRLCVDQAKLTKCRQNLSIIYLSTGLGRVTVLSSAS